MISWPLLIQKDSAGLTLSPNCCFHSFGDALVHHCLHLDAFLEIIYEEGGFPPPHLRAVSVPVFFTFWWNINQDECSSIKLECDGAVFAAASINFAFWTVHLCLWLLRKKVSGTPNEEAMEFSYYSNILFYGSWLAMCKNTDDVMKQMSCQSLLMFIKVSQL